MVVLGDVLDQCIVYQQQCFFQYEGLDGQFVFFFFVIGGWFLQGEVEIDGGFIGDLQYLLVLFFGGQCQCEQWCVVDDFVLCEGVQCIGVVWCDCCWCDFCRCGGQLVQVYILQLC